MRNRIKFAAALLFCLAACGPDITPQNQATPPKLGDANFRVPPPQRLEEIPAQFHGCWELEETAEFDTEPGISAKALGYSSQLMISATELRQDFEWPDGDSSLSIERLDHVLLEHDGTVRLKIDHEQSDEYSDIVAISLFEDNSRTLLGAGGDATVVLSPYRRCGSEPSKRSPQLITYLPERFVGSWVNADESCSDENANRLEFSEGGMTVNGSKPVNAKTALKFASIQLGPEGDATVTFKGNGSGELAGQRYWMTVEFDDLHGDYILHGNFVENYGNGANRTDPPRKRCSF